MHPGIPTDHYVLYGDTGQDTIDYHHYFNSVNVDLGLILITDVELPTPYYAGRATGTRIIAAIDNAVGGSADDILSGNPLSNILVGNMGNDRIFGLEGNDILDGSLGDDYLDGGSGSDRYRFLGDDLGRNFLVEGGTNLDHDILDFSGMTSKTEFGIVLNLDPKAPQTEAPGYLPVFVKSGGFEEIIGTNYNDIILGGAGDETIRGGQGDDTLGGGGGGNNILEGGDGRNTLLEIADSNFTLSNVHLSTGSGSSQISGFQRAVLVDGKGSHRLDASAFSGSVEMIGNGGNDTLIAGSGANSLDGGSGNDVYVFNPTASSQTVTISEFPGDGIDRIDFSKLAADNPVTVNLAAPGGLLATYQNREIRIFNNVGAVIEQVTGGAGDDRLMGSGAANLIQGLGGNDTIEGSGGKDQLEGGLGLDTYLFADNWGSDKLVDVDVATAGGQLDFSAVTGDMKFDIAVGTLKIANGKNKLKLLNTFSQLWGGNGDDLFSFKKGAKLAGGLGEINGQGGVNSLSYASYKTAVNVNLETKLGTGVTHLENIQNVTGGAANDVLVGDDQANTLQGGSGNDQLFGGAGKDLLDGGSGIDFGDGGADLDMGIALETMLGIP